jgi:two-component system chemotaxis sensor kinase CheA
MHIDGDLLTLLRQLRSEVSEWQLADRKALIQIGASLERAISDLPPEISSAGDLLAQCLLALKAIYEQQATDPQLLTRAIGRALIASEQFLLSPENPVCQAMLEQSGQVLLELLRGPEPTAEATPTETSEEQARNLNNIINEFLLESHENLDQLDRDLVTLEEEPSASETLASIFRTIHTIKGSCGFLGFTKLEALTHVGESLLSKLRDGELRLTPEMTSSLLALVDGVRHTLASIEKERHEGEADYAALIQTLTRLQDLQPSFITAPPFPPLTAKREPLPEPSLEGEPIGAIFLKRGLAKNEDIERAWRQQEQGDPRRLGEILVEQGVVKPREVVEALQAQSEGRATSISDNNIRVDVSLLDKLMNLVGELVLARNQVLQFTATQDDLAFAATSQRLNLITSELQEGVMKTRMQPIGNIWSKFPRVVRDLSLTCGKKVRLEMDGKETELDKTIIEAIKDPLTHLVRNSVDHGIETPPVRLAAGKPAEGRLLLRAFHEGGQVNIEITDDGAGIDPERIKLKALQANLITPEQAARLSSREIVNLIFLPGFSTTAQVTNISGRGVGMDVVKTNIEKIGGTLDIHSQPGQGSTIKIKIPLTLAIIPALVITSGGNRYAIPQVSLLELVRLEGEQARRGIEMIHGTPVYRLRGNLLPLVYLNRELRVEDKAAQAEGSDEINIVILQADDRQFGLVVDEINDTEEIVVKPLGKQLKGLTTFAGATIMGDGRVALILDALGIAQRARVVSEVRHQTLADKAARPPEQAENRRTLLLFKISAEGQLAIPLALVARLEEFPLASVEKAGEQEVVQYRGQILPLIRLSRLLGGGYAGESLHDPLQVVVYAEQGRSVGLVVERILDIVEEALTTQYQATREGLLGSAIIQQRVTDLLDVHSVIRLHNPAFFEQPTAAEARL